MADQLQRSKKREFFIIENCTFDAELKLHPFDMVVYLCLLRYADNGNRTAFPGHAKLAKVCNMSNRRVRQAITTLKDRGFIKVQARFDKTGAQKSNLYTIFDPSEVIHRGGTPCQGGWQDMPGAMAPDAGAGWHEVPTKKTYIKRLSEEDPSHIEHNNPDRIEMIRKIRSQINGVDYDS